MRIRFWRPDTNAVTGMVRIENEDRARVTYLDQLAIVVVYSGAFDGWHRGRVRTLAAGSLEVKAPGEVHRDVRVHAPFTIQAARLAPELVASAADALGIRDALHFRPTPAATRLAFAMHDALVREGATEIERTTLVAELLGEILSNGAGPEERRAPRAVRRARAFLHDAFAEKITLDDLAAHAMLDKFHLVRAFRAEVGLPPYAYLTHVRVARAGDLLRRGVRAADAAHAVGFCDESQLHRHFRRIVGIAPGAYARQHRPRQLPRVAASCRS